MKLNRLMGILVALMLLLSALGVSAEEVPESTLEAGCPLYVVLVDCGWTLYGGEVPSETSVVNAVGDAEGRVLSFVEGVLPKLTEPASQMLILGYNDHLRGAEGITPVSAGDAAAISAQVDALRGLNGRQSSLLNVALEELNAYLDAFGSGYDVRLAVISGGAVNYGSASAMNAAFDRGELPLTKVKSGLDALRADGVKVSSYVWDLHDSARLRADHPQLVQLLLTESAMGENCTMISGAVLDLMVGVCDTVVAAFGGEEYEIPTVTALKDADLTGLKSNDAAVIMNARGEFEAYAGENIAADLNSRRLSAAEGDVLRLYSAVNVTEADRLAIQENRLSALIAQLDADQNGALDAVLEVNGGAVTLPAANAAGYVFAAEPADAFSVTADEGNLTLTAMKSGAAKLIVTTADGAMNRELNVGVADYGVTWNIESGAVLYVGEPADIAACADPANVLEGTVTLNGVPAADAQMGSSLQYAPAEAGQLTVSVGVAGRAPEERTFAVHYRLSEDARSLTMKVPYFKVQEGQNVQLTDAQGNAISLKGFAASESALAEIYYNENGDGLFIVPKAAGAETITFTHAASGQIFTLNLTVNSLFSDAMFWGLAAGAPVCLIGLTAMIVLLIVKLGGKRR